MSLTDQTSIIIPRAITRFGDHAWELAVPILLIKLYPGTLDYVAAYGLAATFGAIFIVPKIAAILNHQDRLKNLNHIILTQLAGVAVFLSVLLFSDEHNLSSFIILTLAGVAIRSGSSLADLTIVSDWIPRIFTDHSLSTINSRLRRADLIMEVAGPLAAGFILLIPNGFEIIAIINLLSFIAEWFLLKQVYQKFAAQLKPITRDEVISKSTKLIESIKITAKHPTFPLILGMAAVWYTVLTPHGNLLAAHLKANFQISEDILGMLRSLGALIGIVPTLYYSAVLKKTKPIDFAAYHILFQFMNLIIAALSLHLWGNLWLSLGAIILSRVGLYGFLLAGTETLQRTIHESIRMEISAVASSLKYSASMLLYIAALIWSNSDQFIFLSFSTVLIIGIGALFTWRARAVL